MMEKKRGMFVRGLIILLPTIITIFLLLLAFRFINNNIAQPLGAFIIYGLNLIPLNVARTPLWASLIGFPVTIILIYLIGYFTGSFLGKNLFKGIEIWIMTRFPIIKEIYPYAKQFIDTFISIEKKTEFKAVVAVEFPHPGMYVTGFITADGLKDLHKYTGKKMVTVFVANSPAPFTGFTLFVPEDKIVRLNMSIDEALRVVMSGGVLTPPHQQPDKEKESEVSTGETK